MSLLPKIMLVRTYVATPCEKYAYEVVAAKVSWLGRYVGFKLPTGKFLRAIPTPTPEACMDAGIKLPQYPGNTIIYNASNFMPTEFAPWFEVEKVKTGKEPKPLTPDQLEKMMKGHNR